MNTENVLVKSYKILNYCNKKKLFFFIFLFVSCNTYVRPLQGDLKRKSILKELRFTDETIQYFQYLRTYNTETGQYNIYIITNFKLMNIFCDSEQNSMDYCRSQLIDIMYDYLVDDHTFKINNDIEKKLVIESEFKKVNYNKISKKFIRKNIKKYFSDNLVIYRKDEIDFQKLIIVLMESGASVSLVNEMIFISRNHNINELEYLDLFQEIDID